MSIYIHDLWVIINWEQISGFAILMEHLSDIQLDFPLINVIKCILKIEKLNLIEISEILE